MNIITALINPKINKKLKEKTNFNIIGNDIQYQEGILEMLEKTQEINLIIISELLPGNDNFYELINKIKNKNNKIEIITILKEKNEQLKNQLISKGVFDIFYDNKITIEELINLINKKNNIKKEEDFKQELKNIILEKNKRKILNVEKIKLIKNKICKKNKKEEIKNKKIISVVGNNGTGKTLFCVILSKIINNKKILIIDLDVFNNNINSIFGIKKQKKENKDKINKVNKNIDLLCCNKEFLEDNYKKLNQKFWNLLKKIEIKYDLIIIDNSSQNFFEYNKEILKKSEIIIFLLEPNIIELNKSRNLLNLYINKWKIKNEKINIVFNKVNINSIENKILNNLFSDFNILGKIKTNNKYNLIINKNIKIIDKKIKKDYFNILNKVKL